MAIPQILIVLATKFAESAAKSAGKKFGEGLGNWMVRQIFGSANNNEEMKAIIREYAEYIIKSISAKMDEQTYELKLSAAARELFEVKLSYEKFLISNNALYFSNNTNTELKPLPVDYLDPLDWQSTEAVSAALELGNQGAITILTAIVLHISILIHRYQLSDATPEEKEIWKTKLSVTIDQYIRILDNIYEGIKKDIYNSFSYQINSKSIFESGGNFTIYIEWIDLFENHQGTKKQIGKSTSWEWHKFQPSKTKDEIKKIFSQSIEGYYSNKITSQVFIQSWDDTRDNLKSLMDNIEKYSNQIE